MKRAHLLYFLFILTCLGHASSLHATHIVGGEFEIKEKRGGLYDIFLNLYFDEINGNPQAIDDPLEAVIFDKATNTIQEIVPLYLEFNDVVPYENPDCAIDELSTRLLRYKTRTIYQFDPSNYDDPEGYYIVYDRCCRNNIIDNIVAPENTGMLFYLWFPPIYQPDGSLTGYSSPVFNIIKTRYACLDEYFYMDFGATDVDGDSLVYSMIRPLRGNSNSDDPIIDGVDYMPEPYPEVIWIFGYSDINAINGAPALGIDPQTGLMEVIAADSGLFVFSVVVEEYRNGIKIGEVRRDFQIVVAPCDPNDAPVALMKTDPAAGFYQEGDTIYVENDGDRCFDFFITDDKDPRANERISVVVNPINFTSNDNFGLSNQSTLISGADTLKDIQMCWPICEYLLEEPYLLDVIVSDDGCILPKSDTIHLTVVVEADSNEAPELSWLHNGVSDTSELSISVYVDSLVEIDFTGVDANIQDQLILSADPLLFSFQQTGMVWSNTTATGGSVTSKFSWRPDCDLFATGETDYSIYFYLRDNSCYPELHEDSVRVNLNLIDIPREVESFIPGNIFTPNGDGKNDVFQMPTLPNGVCGDKFVEFEIYNRWGRKLFGNSDRDFRWDGADVPDGMYFYVARFEKSVFKGYVYLSR